MLNDEQLIYTRLQAKQFCTCGYGPGRPQGGIPMLAV